MGDIKQESFEVVSGETCESWYTHNVRITEQKQRILDEEARLQGERFKFFEPQQRLGFYSDILRGVPSTQVQQLTSSGGGQPQTPMFQQLLGAATTGLGLYGAGSKLGLF